MVFSDLQNKEVLKELFDNVAEKIATRPGGYCRIIKTGFRKGDGAEMAMIELVDYNTTLTAKTGAKGATRRGRRKSGSGGSTSTVAAVATAAVVTDVVTNEEE